MGKTHTVKNIFFHIWAKKLEKRVNFQKFAKFLENFATKKLAENLCTSPK